MNIKIKKHKKDHVGFDDGFNVGKKKAATTVFYRALNHLISSVMFSVLMTV